MPILQEDGNLPTQEERRKNAADFFRGLLILLLIFFTFKLVNWSVKDYCFAQHRRLTDKEYISIVLSGLLKSGKMNIHDWDNTVDTYLAHHPCCWVSKDPQGFEVLVTIKYEMSDALKKQSIHTHYEDLTFVTVCGQYKQQMGESYTRQR